MKKALIKRVGVVVKHGRKKALNEAKRLDEWLGARKISCFFDASVAEKLDLKPFTNPEKRFSDIDLLIVLGGDGTLLSTINDILDTNVPILGVNMGSLGFLTEVTSDKLYPSLERVLAGDYKISRRSLLCANIIHNGKKKNYHVLNDVVVNKRELARIIELELTINDMLVTTYKSDGLIIATPTGSTAYSLSAGGPITYPSVDGIVISPVCSHTLTLRPIVVPGNAVIKVKLISKTADCQLTLDGQLADNLENQNEVVIKKSAKKVNLIKSFERNYFDILRTKMHWGKRGGK